MLCFPTSSHLPPTLLRVAVCRSFSTFCTLINVTAATVTDSSESNVWLWGRRSVSPNVSLHHYIYCSDLCAPDFSLGSAFLRVKWKIKLLILISFILLFLLLFLLLLLSLWMLSSVCLCCKTNFPLWDNKDNLILVLKAIVFSILDHMISIVEVQFSENSHHLQQLEGFIQCKGFYSPITIYLSQKFSIPLLGAQRCPPPSPLSMLWLCYVPTSGQGHMHMLMESK